MGTGAEDTTIEFEQREPVDDETLKNFKKPLQYRSEKTKTIFRKNMKNTRGDRPLENG